MYKFCTFFCACVLSAVSLTGCDTAQMQPANAPQSGNGVYFVVPPGDQRQAEITALLQHPDQSENGDMKVIRQYVSAGGSSCVLMGIDRDSSAGQWIACQNAADGWVVKPALLNADAVFGIVR